MRNCDLKRTTPLSVRKSDVLATTSGLDGCSAASWRGAGIRRYEIRISYCSVGSRTDEARHNIIVWKSVSVYRSELHSGAPHCFRLIILTMPAT